MKYVQWEPSSSRQTYGHDKAHSCFLQFCEHVSQLVQRVNKRGKQQEMIIAFQIGSCPHLPNFLRHLFCRAAEGRVSRIGGVGGNVKTPREVDACMMRVGSWWSMRRNAVLFPYQTVILIAFLWHDAAVDAHLSTGR